MMFTKIVRYLAEKIYMSSGHCGGGGGGHCSSIKKSSTNKE